MGRPAKHLIRTPVDESEPGRETKPQLTFQGRDQTSRPDPETHGSKPTRYPFKSKSAAHGGSSFLRTCGWGGVAKLFFNSFRWLVMIRELKRAGPIASPLARGPAVG